MFKSATFVLAALAPSVAMAQDTIVCPTLGLLAESVMEARQEQVPMSELLDLLTAGSSDPIVLGLTRAIIMDAYSRPGFGSPANQQRAIAAFRVDVEFACYEAAL